LVNTDKNIQEILCNLKIIPSLARFSKENKQEKLSELLVSLLCLTKNRNKYTATSAYKKQWRFFTKDQLDEVCSQKLDKSYWHNLNVFIKTNLKEIEKETSEPSKNMILYTLLSLEKSKLVNRTSELNTLLSDNTLDYVHIRNSEGKLNDAASRADLFKRTNTAIDNLNTNSKRNFSNNMKLKKLEEQNGKCGLCGENIPSVGFSHGDHVVPFSRGGSTSEDNLMVLCEFCNKSKGSNTLKIEEVL
jgi:5-methylcytosine-specific restriction endonuclease McrA